MPSSYPATPRPASHSRENVPVSAPNQSGHPLQTPRSQGAIGSSVVIKGEIHSGEDLYLDGQIEGKLELGQHRLTIGPNAKVRASIRAREVEIMGAVNGDVEAAERIIIRKNARLVGDLKMAGVVIEDGAYFKGSIDITQGAPAERKPTVVTAEPPARPAAAGN